MLTASCVRVSRGEEIESRTRRCALRGTVLVALVLFLSLASFMYGGCGKEAGEKAAEKAIEKAIESKTGHDAEVDIGGDVDISALPKFLRYPGAKPMSRWSGSDDSGEGTAIVLETGDSQEKVIEWYEKHLADAGWTRASMMQMQGGTLLGYIDEAEEKGVSVTVNSEGGKTRMTLVLGQHK
jgi:hypothetical protein